MWWLPLTLSSSNPNACTRGQARAKADVGEHDRVGVERVAEHAHLAVG